MMATLDKELRVAIDAVRSAAKVCQAVQSALVTEDTLQKKDRSPVTVADFASQAVVCAALDEALGKALGEDVRVVGEENADELRQDDAAELRAKVVEHVGTVRNGASEEQALGWIDHGGWSPDGSTKRYWTLDPIDGTKGFLRGQQYAIALALIEDGKVMLGVLGCPNLPLWDAVSRSHGEPGTLAFAVRGQGARVMGINAVEPDTATKMHVSEVTDPALAPICESVESGHTDQSRSGGIAAALGTTAAPVRMDSQCKYAAVARGEAAIYLRLPTSEEYREKIWDHAAGAIVVEEAGGKVTDIHGKPLDFSLGRKLENNQGIIATNGHVHDAVLKAVAAS